MHLAVQESDSNAARRLKSAAKRMLRNEKNKSWREFINKTAIERSHFKLANSIFKKDFIKIKSKKFNFSDSSNKMPTISVSVDHTKQVWREFYEKQFEEPNLTTLPAAPDIDSVDTSNPILLEVDQSIVEEAFDKCKKGSSAGPTGITYSHLQSAFNADRI
jgi:hypothetical protein